MLNDLKVFQNVTDSCVFKGNHITVPSVLQESKDWLTQNINIADYVDPEIGHMALAAQNNGIEFSYFHIISDNLSVKYDADLSNERKKDVIVNRKKLCCKIASVLKNI